MFSKYFYELDETAKHRYRDKLDKVGLVDDPYATQGGIQSVDWRDWPQVEYPDVYNYLIQTPCIYTGESLRAYKSLDGYNFCVNGWVSKVSVLSITRSPDAKLTTASVKHSQRLSATPLKPWVVAKMEGTIICGHCTCMAGLGEACSHIAALLFTLERNTQYQQSTTCTSLPCAWLPPSYQDVLYSEIAGIDFTTPHLKRKRAVSGLPGNEVTPSPNRLRNEITPPTNNDLGMFYNQLFQAEKAVLLSLVPEYSDHYVPLCKWCIARPTNSTLHD